MIDFDVLIEESYSDFNPWDNDILFEENYFLRKLLATEPQIEPEEEEIEWDGESEPPKSYTPEGDDYVQGGCR